MTDPETHATDVACPYCARVFAREDQEGMRIFEYFSNGEHDTTFFG